MLMTAAKRIELLAGELDEVSSAKHRLFLAGILLCGLLLRLYSVYAGDGFQYYGINDEVSAYQFILAFLAGEPYALYLGQPFFTGAQVPGPLWTIYGAALFKLGGDQISTGFYYSALLNSFVVYLVYRISRLYLSGSYALFTTLCFAVFPWPLYHAAGLYNPTLLALFGSLLFLSLWRVCNEEGSRAIFFLCLLLAAIPQFHMIGIFYGPVVLALALVLSPRLNWRWLLLGVLAGAVLYLPYLIGEIGNGWENTRKLFTEESVYSWGWLKVLTTPAVVISSIPGAVTPDSTQAIKEYGDGYFGSYYLLAIAALTTLLLSLLCFFWYLRHYLQAVMASLKGSGPAGEGSRKTLLLGGMIFLPLLLFAFSGHDYATRYAMLIMPLLFMLPAMLVTTSASPRIKRLFPLMVAVLVVFNGYLAISSYHYKSTLLNESDELMPSFRKLERLSSAIDENLGEGRRGVLRLSREIRSLNTPYHKLYDVYGLFVDLEQRYKFHKTNATAELSYTAHLPGEASIASCRTVYRDNNVVVCAASGQGMDG